MISRVVLITDLGNRKNLSDIVNIPTVPCICQNLLNIIKRIVYLKIVDSLCYFKFYCLIYFENLKKNPNKSPFFTQHKKGDFFEY